MAAANVFSSTSFEFEALIAAINNQPLAPSVLRPLFTEQGINSTKCLLERQNAIIRLVPSRPRGAPGQPYQKPSRDATEFEAIHLVTRGAVLADSVQDVREFDGTGAEQPEKKRDEALGGMVNNLEATLEHLRMGAVRGQILDADGITVLLDLYAQFGISQQVLNTDYPSSTVNVANEITQAKRMSEDVIGNAQPTGWLALASRTYMDALRAAPSVQTAFMGWSAAATGLLGDIRTEFVVAGVPFREMKNSAGLTWIEDNTAYLIPLGIPSLLITNFAPADYAETVNTLGLPYYAKAQAMNFNRGYELEGQSNPICLCSNPQAIIKLVNTPS